MRRVARKSALVAVLLLFACSGSDRPPGTPTTEGTTSTTAASTTATVTSKEKAVEEAYLRAWAARARARRTLDASGLSESFAKKALQDGIDEIEARKKEGRYALLRVDQNYTITFISVDTAMVHDFITNHSVLIDPNTEQPLEPDPGDRSEVRTTMELLEGKWKVTFVAYRSL